MYLIIDAQKGEVTLEDSRRSSSSSNKCLLFESFGKNGKFLEVFKGKGGILIIKNTNKYQKNPEVPKLESSVPKLESSVPKHRHRRHQGANLE